MLRDYEKHIVIVTLRANASDKTLTANALQISRRALDKILERHRLARPRYARPLPIPPLKKNDNDA